MNPNPKQPPILLYTEGDDSASDPSTPFLPLPDLFDDDAAALADRLRRRALALHAAFHAGPWPALEPLSPGLRQSLEQGVLPLLQQWGPGDYAEQDAALCRAVGAVARHVKPLLVQGVVAPAGPGGREALLLALLTMESGLEKLELFPEDGAALLNRVDVSLSLDALALVLAGCATGPAAARTVLRGGGGGGGGR